MRKAAKKFDILTICLSVLVYNYIDDVIKLFSDLYLIKFLDILTKSFFSYRQVILFPIEICCYFKMYTRISTHFSKCMLPF